MKRLLFASLLLAGASLQAHADLLISANDGKAELVNGVNTVPDNPVPDNISIIDLSSSTGRV